MPPVLGPASPSPRRLKSWAGASGTTRRPSQSTIASTPGRKPLLDDHPAPGRPEGVARELGRHVGLGLVDGPGHQHPLAGGQAVGLDHPGAGQGAQEGGGLVGPLEDPEAGGGHAGLGQQLLHEGLGALQAGPVGPGPHHQPAPGPQAVGQAVDQGGLGPDDHQVGLDLLGRGGGDAHRVALGRDGGHARVARGHHHVGAARQGQGQGVLAPAAADHQDRHRARPYPTPGRPGRGARGRRLTPSRRRRTARARAPPRPGAPARRSGRPGTRRSAGPPRACRPGW